MLRRAGVIRKDQNHNLWLDFRAGLGIPGGIWIDSRGAHHESRRHNNEFRQLSVLMAEAIEAMHRVDLQEAAQETGTGNVLELKQIVRAERLLRFRQQFALVL